MPYGMYVGGEEAYQLDKPLPARPGNGHYVFAAGRSGRDYATLVQAVAGRSIDTHIACDREAALTGIELSPEVKVLNRCYGDDYLQELKNAAVVVVPLLVDDISAGQMVLIQAMAYRKPIIVTRTTTIQEYVQHEQECLLVERNNAPALQAAIERLLHDPALADRLADGARQAYEQRFCMRAYVNNVVTASCGQ